MFDKLLEDDLRHIERIVVTTDLSPESLRAFGPAAALARRLGIKLTLLHVVHEPALGGVGNLSIPQDIQDAEAFLGKARDALGNDLEIDIASFAAEDIVRAIIEYAEKVNGVIGLSTHGRTGFRNMMIGSVAEKVLRRSTVPVFCVPQRGGG